MQIPSNISDECADALVELLFCAMPAVDGQELIAFLSCILRITEREVRRAAAAERERLLKPGRN
jgi:hypothetical protein